MSYEVYEDRMVPLRAAQDAAKNNLVVAKTKRDGSVAFGIIAAIISATGFFSPTINDQSPAETQEWINKNVSSAVKDEIIAPQAKMIEQTVAQGENIVTFNLATNTIDLRPIRSQVEQTLAEKQEGAALFRNTTAGGFLLLAASFFYAARKEHVERVIPEKEKLSKIEKAMGTSGPA